MEDYYDDDPSLYVQKPDFKGVNWNGLVLAPMLQVFILLLPHVSNFIKVWRDDYYNAITSLSTFYPRVFSRLTPKAAYLYLDYLLLNQDRQLRHHMSSTKQRKDELLQLKKELSTISMTDEFARHAKLQRRVNAIQDALTIETTEATNKATAYVFVFLNRQENTWHIG